MATGKTYEIDTFEKLCNLVSEDNYEALCKDLCLWLGYHLQVMNEYKKKHPEDADKKPWDIAKTHFIWIDDGENDLKKVVLRNKDSGEVMEVSVG